jgi:hypothetical protein
MGEQSEADHSWPAVGSGSALLIVGEILYIVLG